MQNMPEPKILYKGLSKSVSVFEPEIVATRDIGKLLEVGIETKKCIWAASDPDFATLFAVLPSTLIWRPDYESGKPVVIIEDIYWQEKLDMDQTGFIYQIPANNFTHIKGVEYIATERVFPLSRTLISTRKVLKNYTIYILVKSDITSLQKHV